MVTYAQLDTEQVWRDQVVPDNLRALVVNLEGFYDPNVTNIGAYGDNRHLRGYHRSRAWILNSRFCTNRTYSVTETAGNRSGGDSNWICGVDIVVGQARSEQIFRRVNEARQRGRVSYVRQVLLERDPWHVHLSLDRLHANDNHSELFAVITGTPYEGGVRVNFNVEMPVLRQGAEGGDVRTAQALLGARGFAVDADGDFGPKTEAATKAMQQRYGAEMVDGIWGQETWTIGITGEDRL